MKKQILFGLIVLLLALPSAQAAKKDAPLYFPPAKGQWEKIDPAKIGWNPSKLKELMDYAGKNKSSGVVILYRGRILAEQYWPLDPKEKTAAGKPNPYFHMRLGKNTKGRAIEDVASAQKSVTAMLVGIAQHKGLLKITDPVHKHLGKGWSKAPAAAEAKITIRHLITMSSGLNARLQFVAPAGTKWFYNTGAYSKALTCVSKAAKMDANELTKKWLTGPLGMKDSRWAVRPWQTSVRTDANRYGFATTARDLARFGIGERLAAAIGGERGASVERGRGGLGGERRGGQEPGSRHRRDAGGAQSAHRARLLSCCLWASARRGRLRPCR